MTPQAIARYRAILDGYLRTQDETHLAAAAELGRELVAANVPPEDIAELHENTSRNLAGKLGDLSPPDAIRLLSAPLMEMFMAFGLAYRERIEAQRRTEEALRQQSEELARSNAELQQFAYAASHDLQEPLRTIHSFLELLQRKYQGQLDATADEIIDFAMDGSQRMQQLIRDLLAYSRVGSRPINIADVELQKVFEWAVSNLRSAVEESDATVTADRPLPKVKGDASQLTQLLQNLMGNAIKFRRPDVAPEITVGVADRDAHWLVSVRDNGIGIEPQFHDKVFNIFRRLHTRKDYPGSGVGLALCRKIVELHGGLIWLESQPGEGTTFFFTLPKHPQHLSNRRPDSTPRPHGDGI